MTKLHNSTFGGAAAGFHTGRDGKHSIVVFVPTGGGRSLKIEVGLATARGMLDAIGQAIADAEAEIGPYRPAGRRGDE